MEQNYKSCETIKRRGTHELNDRDIEPGEKSFIDATNVTKYYQEMNTAFYSGNISKMENLLYEFEILTTGHRFEALKSFEVYKIPFILFEICLKRFVDYPENIQMRCLSIMENLTLYPEDGFCDIFLSSDYNFIFLLLKKIEENNLKADHYLFGILINLAEVNDSVAMDIFREFPFSLVMDILTLEPKNNLNEMLNTNLKSVRIKIIALICKLIPSKIDFDHFNIIYRIVDHLLECKIEGTILYILTLINKICFNSTTCDILSKDIRITELINYVISLDIADYEILNETLHIINKYIKILDGPEFYPRINFSGMVKLVEYEDERIAEIAALFITNTVKCTFMHRCFRSINIIPYFKTGFAIHGFGVQKQIISAICSLIENSTIDEIHFFINNNVTALLTMSLDIDNPDLIYEVFKSLILVFKYQCYDDNGESIPEKEFLENNGMEYLKYIDYENPKIYDIVCKFTKLFDDDDDFYES